LEVGITRHQFGRESSKDHSTKVWFQLAQWLQMSWLKCEKLTDGRTTDDRRRTLSGDNSSHDPMVRWAKNECTRLAVASDKAYHHWANWNQTLVEWSLDDSLPNWCLVIPTSNQDDHQAKNRKRRDEILIVHCCFSISQNELKFELQLHRKE
jgi:hypothetical protein